MFRNDKHSKHNPVSEPLFVVRSFVAFKGFEGFKSRVEESYNFGDQISANDRVKNQGDDSIDAPFDLMRGELCFLRNLGDNLLKFLHI